MRVLITGGTGFVGGAVAGALLAADHHPVVLARDPARAAPLAAAGAAVVPGDITHPASLAAAARGCDAAVHAAGLPRPASWRTFRRVHVGGTANLVAAAAAAGLARVVNIASQAVLFAGADLLDVDESAPYPARHIDPYSATKAEAERLALAAGRDGLTVTSLRPGVVWGPGDRTVLPIMARLARSPLGVPMCGDGSNLESTTHIANLVPAVLAALTAPAAAGRAYFVPDPFTVTWKEFLAGQLAAAGVRPKFGRTPRAVALPAAWLLDRASGAVGLTVPLARFGVRSALTSRRFSGARARADLAYAPTVGFEDGLAAVARWVESIGGPEALIRRGQAPAARSRP